MAQKLTDTCKTCNGTGTVPRSQRRLPNGEIDRFDTLNWPVVVCDHCGGSGEVEVRPEAVQPDPASR